MMAELPSQEYLKSRIDYNPDTGEARWKPVDSSYGYNWQRFNAQCANKIIPQTAGINGVTISKAKLLYKLYHNADIRAIRYVNKDSTDYRIDNIKSVDDIQSKIFDKSKGSNLHNYSPISTAYHSLVRYDHVNGNLIWNSRGDRSWDTRFANKVAGSEHKKTYVNIDTKKGRHVGVHRVAWMLYYDTDPIQYQIDHIDCNGLNNCIVNLRLANSSFNNQTKKSITKHFTRRPKTGKFYCSISYNNNNIYLGDFDTEQEANAAYEEAMAKYKPVYQFTPEEQSELDELYGNYPNVTQELQHRCHALQVKALNHYIEGALQ
jgi:hypothetical protein